MRKKSITFIIDKIFWNLLLLLPLISYVVFIISTRTNDPQSNFWLDNAGYSLDYFCQTFFNGLETSVFYISLYDFFVLFGDFVFPSWLLYFLTYCIFVELAHLIFDVLVFLPRIFTKFADKWSNV